MKRTVREGGNATVSTETARSSSGQSDRASQQRSAYIPLDASPTPRTQQHINHNNNSHNNISHNNNSHNNIRHNNISHNNISRININNNNISRNNINRNSSRHHHHHTTSREFQQDRTLSCIYTNPTSLVNKWDEFKSTIASLNSPHIICIAETWFNDKSLKNIESYTLYNRDRENIRGGGVAIYVSNSIDSHDCYDLAMSGSMSEQVWCVVDVGDDSIIVGCIYKPPFSDTATLNEINQGIARAKQLVDSGKYSSMLVVGDFNFPDIDWTSSIGGASKHHTRCRPSAKSFLNTINSCFLAQHVMEPTHLTSHNTLDLVFTDDPQRVCDMKVAAPIVHTDKNCVHGLLTWNLRARGQLITTPSRKLLYAKGDYASFQAHLAKHDWKAICNHYDVNDAYSKLLEVYNDGVSKFVPSFSLGSNHRRRSAPAWFSNELRNLTKRKYKLFSSIRAGNHDC